MTNNYAVTPQDMLADGVDSTTINGMSIRKGTVAAFLANADILEDKHTNGQQKQDALAMLKVLAPAIITVGLHRHVVFKNAQVEQILLDAEQSTSS